MKSIRTKISILLICSTLITVLACGYISIRDMKGEAIYRGKKQIELSCKAQSHKLSETLFGISHSVRTLANLSLSYLDDVQRFQTDPEYVSTYTEKLKPIFQQFGLQTEGALTTYIRFNPEFTEPTSGLFSTRLSTEEEFTYQTPTDFSQYGKDDVEHVGWYYIPVENKEPTWLNPYHNANIDVTMVSYVVPLFKDGCTIGVIGMDIDFELLTKLVGKATAFESGYAFLTSPEQKILYHKKIKEEKKITDYIPNFKPDNKCIPYRYQGKDKYIASYRLTNGMYFCLTAPTSELLARYNSFTRSFFVSAFIAFLFILLIGMIVGRRLTKPIKDLEEIILETSQFCFKPSKNGAKLCAGKDEVGQMARSVHTMRQNLRDMSQKISDAEQALSTTMEHVVECTKELSSMSADNSATTEELSAAMEETSATMESIDVTIQNIKQESEAITNDCEQGKNAAQLVSTRADKLRENTLLGSKRAKEMCDSLQERTEKALENAKSVSAINDLATLILDISDQTSLLALNASIEAARAGDAGRGFQVVASEISKLSAQTASTTESIMGMIQKVNQVVTNMSTCLSDSTDFLKENVLNDYDDFLEISKNYTEDAEEYETHMKTIHHSIKTLADGIHEIMEAISGVNATMNETSSGIVDIAEKTQDTTALLEKNYRLVNESDAHIDNLEAISKQLQHE